MGQHLTKKMITINESSDYTSSDEEEEDCTPPFTFKLPHCRLPHFLDTTTKWAACVYETNDLHRWSDLMRKIESYSPLHISEDKVKYIIQCIAEDIIDIHGISKFFPTGHCEECGIFHSVSIFDILRS